MASVIKSEILRDFPCYSSVMFEFNYKHELLLQFKKKKFQGIKDLYTKKP